MNDSVGLLVASMAGVLSFLLPFPLSLLALGGPLHTFALPRHALLLFGGA